MRSEETRSTFLGAHTRAYSAMIASAANASRTRGKEERVRSIVDELEVVVRCMRLILRRRYCIAHKQRHGCIYAAAEYKNVDR